MKIKKRARTWAHQSRILEYKFAYPPVQELILTCNKRVFSPFYMSDYLKMLCFLVLVWKSNLKTCVFDHVWFFFFPREKTEIPWPGQEKCRKFFTIKIDLEWQGQTIFSKEPLRHSSINSDSLRVSSQCPAEPSSKQAWARGFIFDIPILRWVTDWRFKFWWRKGFFLSLRI